MKIPKIILPVLFFLLIIGCTQDPVNTDNNNTKSGNLKALGASANELLSDEEFTSIHLEVVYVTGYKPTDLALNSIAQFISERTFKPDGVRITTRAVASSGKAPFAIEEIAEIEREERTAFNTEDEIAVYIYVADGSNEEDEDNLVAIGTAFRNTSIVLYGESINKIANNSNSVSKSSVEALVLNHEFGHLFGLVDIGSPMLVDHEDQDFKNHCNVENCLMNAKINFGGGIMDMLNNNLPQLDDLCINDLVANGGR